MANYTVWNGIIPAGTSQTAAGARTDGITFTVSSPCTLTGIAFYVPAGETTLAGSSYTGLLWSTVSGLTGTLLTSQAGSGTWTAGAWNWITLSSPVALAPGTTYVAGISSPDQIQYVHNYWNTGGPGAGGMTSGPISVPDANTAPGGVQQGNTSSAATFPAATNASWYGVDIQVAVSVPGGSAPGPVVVTAQPPWPAAAQAIVIRAGLADPPVLTTAAPLVVAAAADRKWFSASPVMILSNAQAPAAAPSPGAPVPVVMAGQPDRRHLAVRPPLVLTGRPAYVPPPAPQEAGLLMAGYI